MTDKKLIEKLTRRFRFGEMTQRGSIELSREDAKAIIDSLNTRQDTNNKEVVSVKMQHPESKEEKAVTFDIKYLKDIIETDPDRAHDALGEQFCNCQPVGETNVVECGCIDYLECFEIISTDIDTLPTTKSTEWIAVSECVYELVYLNYDECYFTIGLYKTLEEALDVIKRADSNKSQLSPDFQESEHIQLMRYNFGSDDSLRVKVLELERSEKYSEESDEYYITNDSVKNWTKEDLLIDYRKSFTPPEDK